MNADQSSSGVVSLWRLPHTSRRYPSDVPATNCNAPILRRPTGFSQVPPNSLANRQKDFFDDKFSPFFRINQVGRFVCPSLCSTLQSSYFYPVQTGVEVLFISASYMCSLLLRVPAKKNTLMPPVSLSQTAPCPILEKHKVAEL